MFVCVSVWREGERGEIVMFLETSKHKVAQRTIFITQGPSIKPEGNGVHGTRLITH